MPQNIGDNRVFEDGIARITTDDAERLSRYLVRTGDIVYSRRGDVEKRSLIREKEDGWLCGTGCLRVRFGANSVDSSYASYYLGHPNVRAWIVRHAQGATMPNLNTSILSNLPFVVPPIEEQRVIAHILGTLDDKIELNRRMNETLEEMARAIFKSWFVDFGPVRAKAEGQDSGLPKHIADLFPDRFEDSELGEIPAGWKIDTLGNLMELAYGKALKQSVRKSGDVAVYGSNGQVGWHDELLVKGPGVVVGRKGNPGFVAWSPEDFFPIDTTFYVVPTDERLSLPFLFYALKTQNLPSLSADSAVPGLNRNFVYQNQQIVPPASILEVFDSVVKQLFHRIHKADEESNVLASIRDTLLPRLLSGELRVGGASLLEGTD